MVFTYTFCIANSRRFVKDKRPTFVKAKTDKKKAANELANALSNEMSLKKEQAKKKQLPKDPWADEDASKLFCANYFCLAFPRSLYNWALFLAHVLSCCPYYDVS